MTEKKEFEPEAFVFVDPEVEPKKPLLYKVVDSSQKGDKAVEDLYFDSKEQAKIHRNNLNEKIGNENFRYQIRKGPDHWLK